MHSHLNISDPQNKTRIVNNGSFFYNGQHYSNKCFINSIVFKLYETTWIIY